MQEFHVNSSSFDPEDYVIAKYHVSFSDASGLTMRDAAQILCKSQTQLGEEKQPKKKNYPMIVEDYNPSVTDGAITMLFPKEYFDPKLGGLTELLNYVLGGCFENLMFSKIRLDDLLLPKSYTKKFKGPRWGVDKIRKNMRSERPFLATAVRPMITSSGLKEHITRCKELAEAGVDIIVEPHILPMSPKSLPLRDRVFAVLSELESLELETPRIYTISMTVDRPLSCLKLILNEIKRIGKLNNVYPCVGISLTPQGFAAIRTIAEKRNINIPIEAHNSLHSILTWKGSKFSVNFTLLMKLARLAGGDFVHAGSMAAEEKYAIPGLNVPYNYRVLTKQWGKVKRVMHVVAGSLNPLWIYKHIYDVKGLDIVFLVAGYIYRQGIKKGINDLKRAIDHSYSLYLDMAKGGSTFQEEYVRIRKLIKEGKKYEEYAKKGITKYITGPS